jgi:hypothetical protein
VFERLSNDDISTAVDELVTSLGVKEETPCRNLVAMVWKEDTEGCIQKIAAQLGLPIRISLSYVAKDFKPGIADRFQSSELSRTDWTGHGLDGITAQVSIPESLPLYGSSSLSGYPIRVRVSENCLERPETFVAIMAHELSHVLLRSLRHPQRDSELHTDLVPILLGFGDCVRKGRKNVQRETSGNVTTTHTTTYGYLTDEQFQFAYNKVIGTLQSRLRDKRRLLTLIAQVNDRLLTITQRLASFREYLAYLDTHLTRKMREDDARRVVRFHAWDYTHEWERSITQVRRQLDESAAFAEPLSHYTSSSVEQLKERASDIDHTFERLGQVAEAITVDVKILRRYVSPIYRLRSAIRRSRRTNRASRPSPMS